MPRPSYRPLFAIALIASLAGFGAATSSPGAARPSLALAREAAAPDCQSPACLREEQLLPWYAAWRMKRELKRDVLLLDARSQPRVGSGSLVPAFDAWVPFVEFDGGKRGAGAMRFHADFANRVDDAVREHNLRSTDPIVVLCDTPYCGQLAALLLQERGYAQLFVVGDATPRTASIAD